MRQIGRGCISYQLMKSLTITFLLFFAALPCAFGQEVKWLVTGSFTTYAVSPYVCCAMPDGGTVTGYFVYDEQTNHITSWDLITSGGNFPFFEYLPSNSTGGFQQFTNNHLTFESTASFPNGFGQLEQRGLEFFLPNPPLPSTPGELVVLPNDVAGGDILECLNCSPYRFGGGTLYGVRVDCPPVKVKPYPSNGSCPGDDCSRDGLPIMNANFTPLPPANVLVDGLFQAAWACGFSNFDWQQTVTKDPYAYLLMSVQAPTTPLAVPYPDPPPGGYTWQLTAPGFNGTPVNAYPFFLTIGPPPTEQGSLTSQEAPSNYNNLKFFDDPKEPRLQPGEDIEFTTSLVGVLQTSPGAAPVPFPLYTWRWKTTFNGKTGGASISTRENPLQADSGTGSGGVTITNINGVQLPTALSPAQVATTASGLAYSRVSKTFNGTVTVKNISSSAISGPLQILFMGMTEGVTLVNATQDLYGTPYLTVPNVASLAPGQSLTASVQFQNPSNATINFTPAIYSGSIN